jgi:hypothetical protein
VRRVSRRIVDLDDAGNSYGDGVDLGFSFVNPDLIRNATRWRIKEGQLEG